MSSENQKPRHEPYEKGEAVVLLILDMGSTCLVMAAGLVAWLTLRGVEQKESFAQFTMVLGIVFVVLCLLETIRTVSYAEYFRSLLRQLGLVAIILSTMVLGAAAGFIGALLGINAMNICLPEEVVGQLKRVPKTRIVAASLMISAAVSMLCTTVAALTGGEPKSRRRKRRKS